MGHFTIDLPEDKKGDVRWGKVHKMLFPFFRKSKSVSNKGYIVQVADNQNKTTFRLFKSSDGEWFKDPEGKIQLDDHTLIQIKNAIIEKESKLREQ